MAVLLDEPPRCLITDECRLRSAQVSVIPHFPFPIDQLTIPGSRFPVPRSPFHRINPTQVSSMPSGSTSSRSRRARSPRARVRALGPMDCSRTPPRDPTSTSLRASPCPQSAACERSRARSQHRGLPRRLHLNRWPIGEVVWRCGDPPARAECRMRERQRPPPTSRGGRRCRHPLARPVRYGGSRTGTRAAVETLSRRGTGSGERGIGNREWSIDQRETENGK